MEAMPVRQGGKDAPFAASDPPPIPSAPEHRQTTPSPENRGRELAQNRTKQRTDRLKERTRTGQAGRAGNGTVPAPAEHQTLKQKTARPVKSAKTPPKRRAFSLGDTSAQARKAAHAARMPAQRAREMAKRSRQGAQAAARGIKAAGRALAAAGKAAVSALHSVAAAIAAGGATAVVVVVFVCLIAMVAGSAFGIFFAEQSTGGGVPLQTVVQQLSDDYYAQIREIEQNVSHDRVEYIPDGLFAIRWQDVLSVFAADMAASENGQPVAVLETAQIDRLKEILWQMNPVSYRAYTEEHEEEQIVVD